MKRSIAALALALAMAGTLAACSNRDPNANAGAQNGSNSGTGSASAGQVSRRYHNGRDYFDSLIRPTATTPPAPTARSTAPTAPA